MIMKLKPYPKYKFSGVQWIGEIPEGWEVHRLKFLLKIPVTDGPHETPEFIDEGIPFLSVDSIQDGKLIFENCRYISEEDHIRFKAKCNSKKDDLFLGKAASIGKIAIVDVDFEFSIWSPLALLRPNKKILLPKFLEYSLKSNSCQYQIEIFATSNTQKNISMDDIPLIQLTNPPLPDQIAIANFLDIKTTMIDTLIEKDKRLIELLKEKRAALINHAVTKGLDPNAKMKDSRIEWIGEIPEGWEVRRLKNISKIFGRIGFRGYTINDIVPGGEGAISLSPSNIIENKLNIDKCIYISWHKYYESPEIQIENRDIVFVKTGSTIGKVAFVEKLLQKITINPQLIVFKKVSINKKLLYYFLASLVIDYQIKNFTFGGSTPALNQENIENFKIIIPLEIEQKQIVEHLDQATAKIDKNIQKIEEKIKLLEEYKKSLIHHVVTGKVDVSEVEV